MSILHRSLDSSSSFWAHFRWVSSSLVFYINLFFSKSDLAFSSIVYCIPDPSLYNYVYSGRS